MKERHYIKDPAKPPFHTYPPQYPIPELPKANKETVLRKLQSENWSDRAVNNCRIDSLREIIIALIESDSLPKDFDQVVFSFVVIEEADLTELAIPFKLHFQNGFFLKGLHLNRSSFSMLTVSGYIHGNLSLKKLKETPSINVQNLQVDQVDLVDCERVGFGASTTKIGRLIISNIKNCDQISLHDNVEILDGLWLSDLNLIRGIFLWRCTVHTFFRIYNVVCPENIEIEVCQLYAPLSTRSSTCVKLSLNESKCYGRIDLRELQFEEIDIGNTMITGQLLLNLNQLQVKPYGGLDAKHCITIRKGNTLGEEISIAEQLITLHENFKRIPTAIQQEEYCAYQLRDTIGEQNNSKIFSKVFRWISKWFFGYLLIPSRVLVTMIGIIVISTVVYNLSIWLESGSLNFSNGSDIFQDGILFGIGRSLYFSVVTFSTLGYGDIYPMGFLKFVATLEAFSGLVVVPIFAVSLARKLFRW